MLRFKLSQNESVNYDSREFVMPISTRSIAGSAALGKKAINIPDAYDIPAGAQYGFDRRFDEKIGYRTKSMLTVPLISPQRDEVIGVIQLINKKKDPEKKLFTKDDVEEQVVPFDERSEELLGMVAAQAGASLENAMLYEEIRKLFEGFVKASVEAIESRDPTTSGHSRRVADLTVELARSSTWRRPVRTRARASPARTSASSNTRAFCTISGRSACARRSSSKPTSSMRRRSS
jgi:GAF domain-containing protein